MVSAAEVPVGFSPLGQGSLKPASQGSTAGLSGNQALARGPREDRLAGKGQPDGIRVSRQNPSYANQLLEEACSDGDVAIGTVVAAAVGAAATRAGVCGASRPALGKKRVGGGGLGCEGGDQYLAE